MCKSFALRAARGEAVETWTPELNLGLAGRHCTRLVLLDRGRIMADGLPRQVLTPANLAHCFGVTAQVAEGPHGLSVQLLDRIEAP